MFRRAQFLPTNSRLAEIFTKPLTEERLILLRDQLRMALVKELLMSKCLTCHTLHPKDISSNGQTYMHDWTTTSG